MRGQQRLGARRVPLILATVVASLLGVLAVWSHAEAPRDLAFGVRAGVSGPNKGESFQEYEAFAIHPLPWRWSWPVGWDLSTHLDLAAGVIAGAGKTSFIGSMAPGVELRRPGSRFSLLANIGIAGLSEHNFGNQAVGGPLQFVLYAGASYRLSRRLRLSYRYRHMSNAALYRPNPGLEMHLFGLSYHY